MFPKAAKKCVNTRKSEYSTPENSRSKMAKETKKKQPVEEGEIIAGPPIPPDGGWGWIVMLSSFIISVLVDGVCLNIGVFFPYFLETFQESRGKTSIAGSVLNGTYLLAGPITSALANRFGCRKVTMAGALVASIGFFLSTFSPNVDMLIALYGGVAGFGFGLMYLPAIVMVGYYFEARRALATGVAVCGSGIGLFLFAPITEKLVAEYSWKGGLWIISAIVLHGLVCGAAYRPLKPNILKNTDDNCNQEAYDEDLFTEHSKSLVVPDIVITPAKSNQLVIGGSQIHTIKDKVFEGRIGSEECLASIKHPKQKHAPSSTGNTWVGRLAKSQDLSALNNIHTVRNRVRGADKLFQPLQRKDIFYSGSIQHLPEFKSSENVSDYEKKVSGGPVHLNSGCISEEVEDVKKKRFRVPQVVKDMMDFSLLSSPTFLIYLVSCFLVMFGFFVPFAYIPVLALDLGIDSIHAAFLVSVLGITNTIGRIISGVISDQPWVDCVLVNNLTLIFGGVISLCVPFLFSYAHLAAYSALYGLSISPFVSLRSVIIVELLGLDKLTNAFGLVIFSQGLSSYLGSPIAGALADSTGNYHAAFIMAGVSLLASGLMGLPLRRISRWERSRKTVETPEDNGQEDSHLMEATGNLN